MFSGFKKEESSAVVINIPSHVMTTGPSKSSLHQPRPVEVELDWESTKRFISQFMSSP